MRKKEKIEKLKKKKILKKKKEKALWITVVIHSAFGCGETVISPHLSVICIMLRFFFLNYKKRISNRNLIKEKRIIKMLFTSMLMFAVPEQSFK